MHKKTDKVDLNMSKGTKTISETASKKRGRPCVIDDLIEKELELFPEVHTRRGKIDLWNRLFALHFLEDNPRFLWLADFKKMEAGAPHAWKPSILSELGRIKNVEDMKAIALQICELKPKTKEAVCMIRRWRTGKKPSGNVWDLGDKITKAIDKYIMSHQGITWDQVKTALDNVYGVIDELEQKE